VESKRDGGAHPNSEVQEFGCAPLCDCLTRIKAPLYAEAGIPEYWILNLPDDVLEVRREPAKSGYSRFEIYKRGQIVTPVLLPNTAFTADELLA
jgi:Uma2 family endonuclease